MFSGSLTEYHPPSESLHGSHHPRHGKHRRFYLISGQLFPLKYGALTWTDDLKYRPALPMSGLSPCRFSQVFPRYGHSARCAGIRLHRFRLTHTLRHGQTAYAPYRVPMRLLPPDLHSDAVLLQLFSHSAIPLMYGKVLSYSDLPSVSEKPVSYSSTAGMPYNAGFCPCLAEKQAGHRTVLPRVPCLSCSH